MRTVLRLALALCVLVCLAKPALSQNRNSGEIRGTVRDQSGAVVAGVTVTLQNIDTGVGTVLVTNGDGFYDSVSTSTGTYKVGFEKAGFKKLVIGPIMLQVDVITEDATLEVGAISEEVTVTAAAPLVETETGQQGSTLDSKSHDQSCPSLGAGSPAPTGLLSTSICRALEALQTGGSRRPAALGMPATRFPSTATCRTSATSFRTGPAPYCRRATTTTMRSSRPSQEVQINTSSFSAQYGMGGVMFNQISKSGTNDWHGSGYEYFSQNFLNANSYFNDQAPKLITNPLNPTGPEIPNPASQVPYLRYNQFGGSVGGPIIKNKLFFFFDIDRIVNNSANERLRYRSHGRHGAG